MSQMGGASGGGMAPGGGQRGRGVEDLEWFTIDNFAPGIVQKLNTFSLTGASPAPLGAARLENTYRCVALAGGGLGPLPKRFYDYSRTALGDAATRTVTGFYCSGPLAANFNPMLVLDETDATIRTEAFFLGFGYESGGNHIERLDSLDAWLSSASILNLYTHTNATLTGVYGPWYIDSFRDAAGAGAGSVGHPGIVASWQRPMATSSFSTGLLYPDFLVAGSPYVGSAIGGGLLCTHQSRVTVAQRDGGVIGPGWGTGATGKYHEAETIYFSDPMEGSSALGELINVGPENPSSYGVLASLSASDLLGVKHRGGAYLIQGDLGFPTVRHLPGVTSTGGTECNGAGTRLGFVYGVNNGGVYVWAGADESTPLAPQLEDNFWIPPGSSTLRRYKGRFHQWKDYILAPNNWLFDMTTQGWWRLEDTSVYEYGQFMPSMFNNVLFGARTTFSDASPVCISGWHPKEAASSYSWQSQTIPLTYSRRITLREVHLIAQGVGTIVVTLSGSATTNDITVTFTLPAEAATHPVLLRKRLAWEGEYISVRFVSAHTSTGAAPVIHSFRGGYHQDQQVGQSGVLS